MGIFLPLIMIATVLGAIGLLVNRRRHSAASA
jgi:hypothetical protein